MLEKSIGFSRETSCLSGGQRKKGVVMNKVNSDYARPGRAKRTGIFAIAFILLGMLLL